MHKLDIADDRQTAVRYGYRYYFGKPCGRCYGTLRRLSNNGCHSCVEDWRKPYAADPMKQRDRKRVWRAKRKAQQLGTTILESM